MVSCSEGLATVATALDVTAAAAALTRDLNLCPAGEIHEWVIWLAPLLRGLETRTHPWRRSGHSPTL